MMWFDPFCGVMLMLTRICLVFEEVLAACRVGRMRRMRRRWRWCVMVFIW